MFSFLLANYTEFGKIFLSNSMAYIASGVIGALFLMYCCYSGFIYKFYPRHYYGIRFTTKNIAYITLLSAVSVSVTVIVSIVFPVTVFPPIRIAFEGLMIKIAGFIFGPIVGFMSGIITDLLCLMFVPSYIHIAYLIVVASFGFLSGLVGSLNRAVGKHKWVIMVLLNVFLLFFSVFALTATASAPAPKGGIDLFFGVTVSKVALLYVIGLGTVGSFVVVWLLFFALQVTHKHQLWNQVLPIIMLCVISEYWVTALISSWGDIAFLTASQGPSSHSSSNTGYGLTMMARIAMAPGKILFNVIIIFVTYRAIRPLIKKDL